MKEKKFFNTKNVIIGIISIVLIAASATGVTIFLKDRGEASAAQQEQVENLPVTGNEGNESNDNQIANNSEEEPSDGSETSEEPNQDAETPEETTTPNGENQTTPEGTSDEATEGTEGGTTTNTPDGANTGIIETVITQERKVFEDLQLSWTTIALSSITTNMGIYKPELQIAKTATEIVKVEKPDETIEIADNNVPMVRPGDTIIYTIEVSNIGNYKATNVVVTDTLDVFFENQKVEANEPLLEIETLEPGKVAVLKVAYIVTEADIEATEIVDGVEIPKNISNTAIATDGKTTVEDEDETVPVNPNIEEISGTKTWIDDNNSTGTRPESITVNLLADGIKIAEKEVMPDANGDWKYTFTNLPKYNDNKEEIVYTITEKEVEKYTYEVEDYNITNTIAQDSTVEISGTKTWIAPEGTEFPEVTIKLLRDGEEYKTTTVGADGTYSFTGLERYDLNDGHEYVYTVQEIVPEGYVATYDGYNITNTKQITATKTSETSTGVKEVNIGETIDYTITITNNTNEQTKVTVKDDIPGLSLGNVKVSLNGEITLDGAQLSDEDVQKLYNGKLVVDMPANTTRIIKIPVIVDAGMTGDKITNTAYIDGTPTKPVVNPIERTISVTKYKNNITSTNIVLVLDVSSSMNSKIEVDGESISKLEVAKKALINFVNNTYEIEENKNVTFTLITFANREYTEGALSTENEKFHGGVFNFDDRGNYDNANGQYIVTVNNKDNFISAVEKLEADFGTNMRAGLEVAESTMKAIMQIEEYKEYDKILIFFGDGEPYGETSDPGQNTVKGIKGKAQDIKNLGVKVYSIGFGSDAATPGKTGYERLKDISSDGKVYTSNNYTELVKNFSEIVGADPEYDLMTIDGNAIIKIKATDTQHIIVDGDKNPIILTIGGETVKITNDEEAAQYGLTYTDTEIIWDVTKYSKDTNLKLSYHVQ